jgi:hypothetical protein
LSRADLTSTRWFLAAASRKEPVKGKEHNEERKARECMYKKTKTREAYRPYPNLRRSLSQAYNLLEKRPGKLRQPQFLLMIKLLWHVEELFFSLGRFAKSVHDDNSLSLHRLKLLSKIT